MVWVGSVCVLRFCLGFCSLSSVSVAVLFLSKLKRQQQQQGKKNKKQNSEEINSQNEE